MRNSSNRPDAMKRIGRIVLILFAALLVPQIAAAAAWVARHDMSPSAYQQAFNKWTKKGYRLTEVSGYSVNGKERYAAMWVKKSGAPYVARHGMTSAKYQKEFDMWTGKGYRLTKVQGYAVGKGVKYAAIWEKKKGAPYTARHGMTSAQYQKEFDKWTQKGYRLTHVSGYSSNGSPRFAAIWEKKDGPSYIARHNLSSSAYQKAFDEWNRKGYRLMLVSGYQDHGSQRYAAIWEKRGGKPMIARHAMTSANYQSAFDNAYYTGFTLKQVSGFTVGKSARFAAIWEGDAWDTADLAAIEKIIDTFMKTYNVPGLGIAISKDERLVFARGYGYANKETGWRASPKQLFRVASVSKPITSTAIMKLIERGKISLGDKVFGSGALLGTTYGSKAYSSDVKKIKVQHLLEHTCGGWDNKKNDPMFAKPGYNHTELIGWVLDNRALDNPPGTNAAYSNFGYCLLGRVIEKKTGQTYEQYVRNAILKPAGITDMHIGGDKKKERRANEVYYYGQGGEDPYGMKVRRMDSHGGWIASPIDLVRFLVHIDKFTKKKDVLKTATINTMTDESKINKGYAKGWNVNASDNWWHNGSFSGGEAEIVRAGNGFNWAIVLNTRSKKDDFGKDLDRLGWDIQKAVKKWPGYDKF